MTTGSETTFAKIEGDVYMNLDKLIVEVRDDPLPDGYVDLLWWLERCLEAGVEALGACV